jgi:RNA polymerase sigma-70 factor, ECF subfamily
MAPPPTSGDQSPPDAGSETTASLLARARDGDEAARSRLLLRYLPAFRRWAHGRVPNQARGQIDTEDLVQDTFLKALIHMDGFEPRHPGAFLAYLRRILSNRIIEEARRAKRRPAREELPNDLPGEDPSPLETVVGREVLASYEAALAHLSEAQREVVILRLELQFTYEEIAAATGSPTANAARMMVKRGLLRLAEEMEHAR